MSSDTLPSGVSTVRLDALRRPLDFRHPGAGERLDSLPGERPLQLAAYLLVLGGEQMGQHLHNGDLSVVGAVEVGELNAGGSPAHDDNGRRDFRQLKGLPAGDYDVAVDLKAGHGARPCAGGDYDVLCRERSAVAVHGNGVGVLKAGVTVHQVYPVLSEKGLDARREASDHRPAPSDGRAEVVAEVVVGYAEVRGALEQGQHLGVAEEGLAGYAAPVEAHAAHLVRLHDGRLQAKLARPDCGHVAARPRADNHNVIFCVRHSTRLPLLSVAILLAVYHP